MESKPIFCIGMPMNIPQDERGKVKDYLVGYYVLFYTTTGDQPEFALFNAIDVEPETIEEIRNKITEMVCK